MSIYNVVISVLSILPESQFDNIINFMTSVKYKTYLQEIKKEMLSGSNKEAFEFAKNIDVNHYFDMYRADWMKKYRENVIEVRSVKTDSGARYKCVSYSSRQGNGKSYDMYLPGGWKDARVKSYIRGIMIEQDDNSFHQYLTSDEYNRMPQGTVIDIGTAEGNFGLDMLEKSKHLYLFECDNKFVDTLNVTFRKSISNGITKVVSNYVGSVSRGDSITLDDYFEDNMPDDVTVIKMDIEGAEQDALRGMKKLLEKNPQAILLICAYHSQDAEREIRELLSDYKITTKNQYTIVPSMGEKKYPYIRHGVLRAQKNGKE